jgi:hypothetical protein
MRKNLNTDGRAKTLCCQFISSHSAGKNIVNRNYLFLSFHQAEVSAILDAHFATGVTKLTTSGGSSLKD